MPRCPNRGGRHSASEADLLDAYPRVVDEDILAALAYAADTIAHMETVLAGASTGNSNP